MTTRDLSSHMRAVGAMLCCWIAGAFLSALVSAIPIPRDALVVPALLAGMCPFVYFVFLELFQGLYDVRQLKRWTEAYDEERSRKRRGEVA